MTTFSPRLDLPFLEAAQAQKHVTHNEALERLDLIVQGSVEAFDATDPPATAPEGACWHLGDTPTGAWAGQDGQIAGFAGGGWLFITPATGWRLWDRATGTLRVNTGTGWDPVGGAADLDNVAGVGVNTTSDATNRLAVAAEATLLSHDGADHQLKVNKAAAADTASLLFQSGFSGRAEMGLSGKDDFSVKVSADGTTWKDTIRTHADAGIVSMPGGMDGVQVTADFEGVAIVPTPSNGGFALISIVDPLYPQSSASGIFVYDTGNTPVLLSVWTGPAMINRGTQTLTGTTVARDTVSVAVDGIGNIHLENRYLNAKPRQFCITWMNAFRPVG